MLTPFSSRDDISNLEGWLPIDAVVHEGRPGLWWMDMRGIDLREPFLEQTISRARRLPVPPGEKFTEFDAVLQLEKILHPVEPSGFIFHASRCGSTLVANALRALDSSLVLSEPSAVDKLVARFSTDIDGPVKEALYSVILRAVVSALSQSDSEKQRVFLKYSCCSVAQLRRIRRIWPNVPWLFIYRDPAEIIVSNLRNVPSWLEDSDTRVLADIIDIPATQITKFERDELCARSIGAFLGHACRLANDNGMLLNYSELGLDSLLSVFRFFNVAPTDTEIAKVADAAKVYSKDSAGKRAFNSDVADKRLMTSDDVRALAEQWCSSQYFELEQLRSNKSAFH